MLVVIRADKKRELPNVFVLHERNVDKARHLLAQAICPGIVNHANDLYVLRGATPNAEVAPDWILAAEPLAPRFFVDYASLRRRGRVAPREFAAKNHRNSK